MEINLKSYLWGYLSKPQKDLITQGKFIINEVIEEGRFNFNDYSFLVFPFAKAYEGFLKQLFLDVGFITKLDYDSDHFRLGKVMSPNLELKLGSHSVFRKIANLAGEDLAYEIWDAWKMGRNQVFHYFPHNIKSLEFKEAQQIVLKIINTMEHAALDLKQNSLKKRLSQY